jgi:hypothetical protein
VQAQRLDEAHQRDEGQDREGEGEQRVAAGVAREQVSRAQG